MGEEGRDEQEKLEWENSLWKGKEELAQYQIMIRKVATKHQPSTADMTNLSVEVSVLVVILTSESYTNSESQDQVHGTYYV